MIQYQGILGNALRGVARVVGHERHYHARRFGWVVAGFVASSLAVACQEAPAPASLFDFSSELGLAADGAGGPCVLHPVKLDPEARLTAVHVPVEAGGDAEAVTLVIEEELAGRCDIPEGGAPGDASFAARAIDGELSPGKLYTVFVASRGMVVLEGGQATVDLDGVPPRETFRSCTSSEAVHVSVWTGQPHAGIQRWRAVRYLGYDVVPTCSADDFQLEPGT